MNRNRFLFFFIMLLSFTIFVTDRPFVLVDGQDKVPVIPLEPLKWSSDYSVIGNTVSMNNSDLEMSVWPHTSSGGWVYVSFNAKKFAKSSTSLVDLLFGFTESRVSVSKFEVYDPQTLRRDFNVSIDPKYYEGTGFKLGFVSHRLTFYHLVNKTWQAERGVTFDSYGYHLYNSSYTVGWYTYHEYYVEEYHKYSESVFKRAKFKVVGEAENWVSVPVVADSKKVWNIRFWLNVVPTTEENCVGEYWVGVKSSDESLTDALKFKHYTSMDPWWDASWQYKMKLTVDSSLIDSDLTWFPVTVFFDSGNMNWSNVQDDCDDFRFVTGNESVLLCAELEDYTVNTDAVIHVSKDGWVIDSDVDTDFYCYFGNPTAASAWDGENVWNDDYVMIQHMVDDTTSTILDSTSNDNDGTKTAANQPIETASGRINSAQDFDGGDDKITTTNNIAYNDDFTVSFWANSDIVDYAGEILQSNTFRVGFNWGFCLRCNNGGWLREIGFATTMTPLTYYFISKDALHIHVFENLVSKINTDDTGTGTYFATLNIGKGWSNYFNGVLDEIRVSTSIARSDAWGKAEYYSGSDGLLTYGAESELLPPSIGELQAPVIVYPNKYVFLNVSAKYDLGRTHIDNASLKMDGGVELFWDEASKAFSESADPNSYCTLNVTGSIYSIVNSSAYKLSWRVMFSNKYPEGYVDALSSGTKVYTDDGLSASNSKADWFLFTAPPADFAWILALLIAVAALALILLFTKK